MGKVNTCGTIFSRRIDLATKAPKKVGSNAAEQKSTNLGNVDGGVSEEEELVRARNEDGPDQTNDPSTEGRRRH
jgi:hypothetical protein